MNMQPIMGAGTNELRTLWIGDIEPWMNEKHIEDVFNKVGRVISVKLIRSKETNLPAGYCFVEFQTHDMAEKILMNYNSQPIPGASGTFRMNWGKNPTNTGITRPIGGAGNGFPSYSGAATASSASSSSAISNTPVSEFSIYVGELELGVNEQQLADHFRMKYSSVTSSKIITEPSSKLSKGYGFVKFSNAVEGQRAIHEMNGSIFKGKFIKVSQAVSRQAQLASMAVAAQGYQQYGYPPNNGMDIYGQPLQQYQQYYPQSAQSAGTMPMGPHGQQQQAQQGGYDYYQNQYASYAQQQQQPQSLAAQQQAYYQSQYPSQYYGQMQQYSQDTANGYGVAGNSPASSNPSYQPQPQPTPANGYYQQQQQPAAYGYYQQASQQTPQQSYLQQQQQQQTQDLQYLASLPQQQPQQAQIGQTPLAGTQAGAIPGYSQIQSYQQQQQQQQLALQAAQQGQYKSQQQLVQQYPQQGSQLLEQSQQQQQQSQAISQQKYDENNNSNGINGSSNASNALGGQQQQGNAINSVEGDKGQERDFLETDVEYVSAAGEVAFVLKHNLS